MRNPGRSDDGGARPEGADARATHQVGGVGASADGTATGSRPDAPPDRLVDVTTPDLPVLDGVLPAPPSTGPAITCPAHAGPADAASPCTGLTVVPHLDVGDAGRRRDGAPDATGLDDLDPDDLDLDDLDDLDESDLDEDDDPDDDDVEDEAR